MGKGVGEGEGTDWECGDIIHMTCADLITYNIIQMRAGC